MTRWPSQLLLLLLVGAVTAALLASPVSGAEKHQQQQQQEQKQTHQHQTQYSQNSREQQPQQADRQQLEQPQRPERQQATDKSLNAEQEPKLEAQLQSKDTPTESWLYSLPLQQHEQEQMRQKLKQQSKLYVTNSTTTNYRKSVLTVGYLTAIKGELKDKQGLAISGALTMALDEVCCLFH